MLRPGEHIYGLTTIDIVKGLSEEVLKIATELDMTGAQANWDEFAANPGAITTEAIIEGIQEQENAARQQVKVDAVIEKLITTNVEIGEVSLSVEGIIGYVTQYAEATNGADVSGLTPDNVTAMVAAYQELASGADVSTLKPSEIVAYVNKYAGNIQTNTFSRRTAIYSGDLAARIAKAEIQAE